MPYTKRMPHYTSPKQLLEYILDEKNDGEKAAVTSSINCNVETALQEFKDNNEKYKTTGTRVAYHLIQSFHPDDKITPEQANEIGKRMCEELYPEFQCVIVTHADRSHINNHIAINSTNIHGRKLLDRRNNKEGIYGFIEASDEIAAEYGCYIMPRKKFRFSKNKDNYYFEYVEQTWRDKIRLAIDEVKIKVNSIDELLDELSILGYEIKKGKYISLKSFGMSKYARLQSLGNEYSEESLTEYFSENYIDVKLPYIDIADTEFNTETISRAKESRTAILKSQLAAKGNVYTQYQQTKYKEIRRYYQLKNQLEHLNDYNIRSFEDLENTIKDKREGLKQKNIELKEMKGKNNDVIETTNKAQDYIQLKKVYDYAIYYKQQDPEYMLPGETMVFMLLQDELGIDSTQEARNLIASLRKQRIAINEISKEVLDLQRELNHLDTIKEEQLSKSDLYIHNIRFGRNRIDYSNSTDDYWYVKLPYTHEYLKIEKEHTAYNEKINAYTLYLVDDKEYALYDKNGNVDKLITGTKLDNSVMESKKENDRQYEKEYEEDIFDI